MEITLHRQSGFFENALGRALPLSVFFNGKKVGSFKTGEMKVIPLPSSEGILQVGITKADEGLALPHNSECQDISGCTTSSLGFFISAKDEGIRLELGTTPWVLFDIISFCYIPFFSRRVFCIRNSLNGPSDS